MTVDAATTGRLVLDGALTIRTAEVVCAKLLETIEHNTDVSIDCGSVTEVDLSFVQLLIAARVTAQTLHKNVVLEMEPDGALLTALTRGGFRIVPDIENGTYWFDGAVA